MTHDIRVLTDPVDNRKALDLFSAAIVTFPQLADDADLTTFTEPGRQLGAFADGELVGTAASFTSWLIVPGGAKIPHAAVTDVGVLPTHTRRGLAGALIRHQLEQIAERGEQVATLRASEGVIYERFGYGIASCTASVNLMRGSARLRPGVPLGGPVRFVHPSTSWDLVERIYSGITRPGAINRSESWWRVQAFIRKDQNPNYIAVHGEPGAEDGFVRYRPVAAEHWFSSTDRAVMVFDFVATTPAAHYGLLRFLLSIDLVHRIQLDSMPVDHSIEKLMFDERAVRTKSVEDETWLRLVDVPAVLSARTYRGPDAVVLAVTDELLTANTGHYLVSSAGVERTTAAADLSLDVSALATVYLGGTRWWQLAAAGRVNELAEGALARADELFATDRAPFAGTMF